MQFPCFVEVGHGEELMRQLRVDIAVGSGMSLIGSLQAKERDILLLSIPVSSLRHGSCNVFPVDADAMAMLVSVSLHLRFAIVDAARSQQRELSLWHRFVRGALPHASCYQWHVLVQETLGRCEVDHVLD